MRKPLLFHCLLGFSQEKVFCLFSRVYRQGIYVLSPPKMIIAQQALHSALLSLQMLQDILSVSP